MIHSSFCGSAAHVGGKYTLAYARASKETSAGSCNTDRQFPLAASSRRCHRSIAKHGASNLLHDYPIKRHCGSQPFSRHSPISAAPAFIRCLIDYDDAAGNHCFKNSSNFNHVGSVYFSTAGPSVANKI
ncbi:uncharacterized protein LOC134218346 [Armigeres subalbatus]|uniref:uncharacterized protein LOC134218346 n=1 Tax=Armigeres subalbatus TaxID=124917 RepID=UPI002ED529B5